MSEFAESYRVLLSCGTAEIEEKKSRFIAVFETVETEEAALSFIESVRKKHYDARHNCFAFIIGKKSELERCSDDGEPSGTAGRPMLDVLKGAGLTNVVCVVTRYFGGTLLGTGGLTRAYSAAVKEGLLNSEIGLMRYGISYEVKVDYSLVGKMQYLFAGSGIAVLKTDYTDKALFTVTVPFAVENTFLTAVTDASGGSAEMVKKDCVYYIDNESSF